jgi:hypothetical protein
MTIQQFYLQQPLGLSLSCGCHVCFTKAVLSFCVFKTQLTKMDKTGKKHLIFPKIQENGSKIQKRIQQLYALRIQEELNFM